MKVTGVHIIPLKTKLTRFERLKMHLWNFILPPHVRLDDWTKESDDQQFITKGGI